MIIDKDRKLIFIRHQKTASSSILKSLALDKYVPKKNFLRFGFNPKYKELIRLKTKKRYDGNHVPLYELKNIDQEVYKNKDEYFKFGFVRNPWDRMVSAMHYLIKRRAIDKNISLEKFLKMQFNIKLKNFGENGADTKWIGLEMNAVDFNKGCDFIGRFEELQQSLEYICGKTGISPLKLRHYNKVNRNHYSEYYNNETRKIVETKFSKDIEHFGYKFGE